MITKDTLLFLDDLKANNHKEWFQGNQKRYDLYKKNYKEVVEAVIAELGKGDERVAHLEFKNASFRINRDIRFSKDKTPYKTNMAIWMSPGNKECNFAGYYIHIEPGASFIAAGVHWPDAADLKKLRREIDGFYEDLEAVMDGPDLKKIYGELDRDENNVLKSAPKDYDKEHPAIEFLKLKSFTVTAKIADKELEDKDFVKKTVKKLLAAKPLVDFLNRALTTE